MEFDITENKYRKVLIAAQRARQLEKGARPLVQLSNMKTTNIALHEVERGLIGFEFILDAQELEARRD